jgi:hypothetical protein
MPSTRFPPRFQSQAGCRPCREMVSLQCVAEFWGSRCRSSSPSYIHFDRLSDRLPLDHLPRFTAGCNVRCNFHSAALAVMPGSTGRKRCFRQCRLFCLHSGGSNTQRGMSKCSSTSPRRNLPPNSFRFSKTLNRIGSARVFAVITRLCERHRPSRHRG